ncbi:hypothetical protein ADUPG1_007264, partial [Aduncisulcus paluster]
SASGCGLSDISDVLDLTPPIPTTYVLDGITVSTPPFKLTNLILSNNNISDVSLIMTSGLFPALDVLDISDNSICDIDGMIYMLGNYYGTIDLMPYNQTCHCSASVSSAAHQVCREVYPDRWAVECWNGYYLDKASGECLEVCASGSELDTSSGTPPYTCITAASDVDDSIRVQVCERHSNMKPVLEVGDSSITCGCRSAWYGDDCDQLYQVYIPDEDMRKSLCYTYYPAIYNYTNCDISELEIAKIPEFSLIYVAANSSNTPKVTTMEGLESAIQISSLNINCNYVSGYPAVLVDPDYHNQLENLYISSSNVTSLLTMKVLNLELSNFSQLKIVDLSGNPQINDISVFYRNIGMEQLILNGTVPLCHSEDQSTYLDFIQNVFPLHDAISTSESDLLVKYYNNSCNINNTSPAPDTQRCSSNVDCPSIVANEIYVVNSEGVGSKECAYIAFEYSDADFIQNVFPLHDAISTSESDLLVKYYNNSCNINNTSPAPDTQRCSSNVDCPSIVANEIYVVNSEGVGSKECAYIAFEYSDAGLTYCYTVHDSNVRSQLNQSLGTGDTSALISVATLRSSALSGFDVSSLGSVTSLRGLEFVSSLTELIVDGYDLSINPEDREVVKLLAKHYSNPPAFESGLELLSSIDCGIERIEDIFDISTAYNLQSSADGFRFTSLNLSYNDDLTDISIFTIPGLFSSLTSLTITNCSICDSDSEYQISTILPSASVNFSSSLSCPCGVNAVSFQDHQTCRYKLGGTQYPQVECWYGYYFNRLNGKCTKACIIGYMADINNICVLFGGSTADNILRTRVCERRNTLQMAILEENATGVTCGCKNPQYIGDMCNYVYIPDDNLRAAVCEALHRPSYCNDLLANDMERVTSLTVDNVATFYGLSFASNLESLSVTRTDASLSVSMSDVEIGYIPTSNLVELTLNNMNVPVNTSFAAFSVLEKLTLQYNISYNVSSSGTFHSSLKYLDVTGCTGIIYGNFFTSYNVLSDTVSLNSIEILVLDNTNLTDFAGFSQWITTHLSITYTGITSISPLFNQYSAPLGYNNSTLTHLNIDGLDSSVLSDVKYFPNLEYLSARNMNPKITDSDLLNIASCSNLTTLYLSDNLIADVSPLYHLGSSLVTLDISHNSICLGFSGLETLYTKFQLANDKVYPPTILAYSQDTSSCDFCSSSETAGDPVIHCSDPYSISLDSNKICRKVWEWTELVDDGAGGMTLTYHEQWSVECNLYSYKAGDGSCVSYSDYSSIPSFVEESCFTASYDSSGDYMHSECIVESGNSVTSCIDDWYMDGSDNCTLKCPYSSVENGVCNDEINTGTGTACNEATHTCACFDDNFGDLCQYVTLDSALQQYICDYSVTNVLGNPTNGVTCNADGYITVSELGKLTGELDLSGLTDMSSIIGMNYITDGVTKLILPKNRTTRIDCDFTRFANMTSLLYLDVSECDMSTEASVLSLSSLNSLQIETLIMNNVNISASYIPDFSGIASLKYLKIQSNLNYDASSSADFPNSSSSFISLDISGSKNFDIANVPSHIHELYANNCELNPNQSFSHLTNLQVLSIKNNAQFDIINLVDLTNLKSLNVSYCNISDPSPLYALSNNGSWNSIDLSYNHICGGDNGDSAIETFLASKFSLSTADVNASGQACECSSDDLGSTPLDDNKVCSETKPGVSNTWYVVCASDSYTSYTSAEDFTCMQTTSPTTNCSGGCEYGYECRYLGDEVIGGVTYTTGECQQVIVDPYLHDCVADMFVDVDGTTPNYLHRTDDTVSLFSVASLKTLVSEEISGGEYFPIVSYNDTLDKISNLAGLEHLGGIKYIEFKGSFAPNIAHVESLSTLTNLVYLYLTDNLDLSLMPDLSSLSFLETLSLENTSVTFPSDRYVLPSSIKTLSITKTNIDTAGFDRNISFEDHLSNLERLSIGSTGGLLTSINSLTSNQKGHITKLKISNTTICDNYSDTISEMTNLNSILLNDCGLTVIPDLSNSASTLTVLNISLNPLLVSLSPVATAGLSNLTTFEAEYCRISDPSPLYDVTNTTNNYIVDLSYNYICGSIDQSKFNSLPYNLDVTNQYSCGCTSDTPSLSDNMVCAETKPGSGSWYVVCASDSYTSYTSAEDFTCIQTTSQTTNCSGGCEYGYECRYLGDEVIDGVTYSTGECQQVIVDNNLHDYVADLFNDYDGTANYIHRTADTPSLFSVASLKTLVSVAINNQYYPQIQYNDSSLPIDDLSGIEHLGGIKLIGFSSVFSADSDDIHLDLLSTLTNLVQLNLSRNSSLSYLPNITSLTSLEVLGILKTSIILPSEEYILPTSLKGFYCNFSNVNNEGFAKNVGDGYLPDIEQLVIGGDNNLLTSIDSLTTSQKENMKNFSWRSSPIDTFENYPDILAEMPNLESLSLFDCNLQTIPDLSIQAETLTILNISLNPLLASLTPIVSSDLTNLTYLYASGCAISDPSPLFALSSNTSWSYIYLANNYICGDDLQTIFEDIFSSSPDLNINVSNQTCGCSDSDPIPSLSDNKVCAETKPGSGSWYVVCASDSYTSYTSAEDFT